MSTIIYDGKTTALGVGQTATFPCAGSKAVSDIVVKFDADGKIIYNGVTTDISDGQTATMTCGGKKMKSDVVVFVGFNHALYNGVRLPAIPKSVLAEYPYAWIRKHTTNDQYQLILSAYPWYYKESSMYCSGGTEVLNPWYNVAISTADTATEWTFNKNVDGFFPVDETKPVMWANHDIPNGSATATEIYFNGTSPVPSP